MSIDSYLLPSIAEIRTRIKLSDSGPPVMHEQSATVVKLFF